MNMFRNSCPSPNPQIGPTRLAEQLPHKRLLALVASREHDQVGLQHVAVAKPGAVGDELRNVGKLNQTDLALDDQIRATDVEVIAAAPCQVLELPTCRCVAMTRFSAVWPSHGSSPDRFPRTRSGCSKPSPIKR